MRGRKSEDVPAQDGATTNAETEVKRTRRPRKPRNEGAAGDAAVTRRRRKPTPNQIDVFGVQSALYDRMQLQAQLVTIAKTHLEAMQRDFCKLAPEAQKLCNGVVEKAAQSVIDYVTNMKLVPKPDMTKPEALKEQKEDVQLKKAVENL